MSASSKQGFFDGGANDGRGGDTMRVFDEQGKAVNMSEIGGTGVHIDGVHQTHEDLARIKQENPELHAEIQKMRGSLVGRQSVESGGSKGKAVSRTAEAGGEVNEVIPQAPTPAPKLSASEPKPGFKLRDIHSNLTQAHRILSDHINTLRAHQHLDETGTLSALLDVAGGHVDAVGKHLERADSAMRGFKIHNSETGQSKFFTQQHEAPKHMDNALKLLDSANEIMSHHYIGLVHGVTGTSAGNPSGNLEFAEEGLNKARRKRGARPWKTMNIGGRSMPTGVLINPDNPEHMMAIKDARRFIKGTILEDKIDKAMRGTPRGQRAGADRPDKQAGTARIDTRYRGSSRIKGPGE